MLAEPWQLSFESLASDVGNRRLAIDWLASTAKKGFELKKLEILESAHARMHHETSVRTTKYDVGYVR